MTATHAYQSLEEGAQIVVSDGPREDLEELARWVSIPVPDETENEVVIPDGTPTDKWAAGEIKAYAERASIDLGEAKNKTEYLKVIADKAAADAAAKATTAGSAPAGGAASSPE